MTWTATLDHDGVELFEGDTVSVVEDTNAHQACITLRLSTTGQIRRVSHVSRSVVEVALGNQAILGQAAHWRLVERGEVGRAQLS